MWFLRACGGTSLSTTSADWWCLLRGSLLGLGNPAVVSTESRGPTPVVSTATGDRERMNNIRCSDGVGRARRYRRTHTPRTKIKNITMLKPVPRFPPPTTETSHSHSTQETREWPTRRPAHTHSNRRGHASTAVFPSISLLKAPTTLTPQHSVRRIISHRASSCCLVPSTTRAAQGEVAGAKLDSLDWDDATVLIPPIA